jgi:hypothetical protein
VVAGTYQSYRSFNTITFSGCVNTVLMIPKVIRVEYMRRQSTQRLVSPGNSIAILQPTTRRVRAVPLDSVTDEQRGRELETASASVTNVVATDNRSATGVHKTHDGLPLAMHTLNSIPATADLLVTCIICPVKHS